jgi:RNA polymerase sigma-70 factor (ECF subfamily)
VARFFHRLGFAPADVADLVQNVFLVAHQKGGFDHGAAKPRTWLYAIAYRVAADERRRRRRRPVESLDGVLLEDTSDPETKLQHLRSLERVLRCLQKLDLLHRAAFILFEVEGLSGKEVAESLEIPVGTVYRRVHVARARFEAFYRAERDAEP